MKLNQSLRYGLLINIWLLLMVLGTALLLVRWQYESRRLYVALEKAESQGKQLEADNARALADKRQLSAPARVQQVATQQLAMREVDPAVTLYLGAKP